MSDLMPFPATLVVVVNFLLFLLLLSDLALLWFLFGCSCFPGLE